MSHITLRLAKPNEAGLLCKMQQTAFAPLVRRYQENTFGIPCESIEKIFAKITEPNSCYYLILLEDTPIGGVRVVDHKSEKYKHLSPIFILPQYQRHGYAGQAVLLAEQLHGLDHWQLNTILEEAHLCRFYESLGYRKTGKTERIGHNLTLVYYEK